MNSSEALDDLEGLIAFLNNTELEPVLPAKCEMVIGKMRQSGFLWRMARKRRMEHVKLIVSKCVCVKFKRLWCMQRVYLYLPPGQHFLWEDTREAREAECLRAHA